VIWTRSTARLFLVCIYLLNYFVNCKFPAVKQSVFLLDQKIHYNVAGVESSMERNQGTPRERKFHSMELSSPVTKVPGDESS